MHKHKKIWIFLLLILLNNQIIIFAENSEVLIKTRIIPGTVNQIKNIFGRAKTYKTAVIKNVAGISGTIPYQIYLIIEELKKRSIYGNPNPIPELKGICLDDSSPYSYGAILYGPPGNGKSMLAKKIAELTNSEFMEEKGSTIVQRYIGQGAQNIDEIFKSAEELSYETGKRVIIFFDEVDVFACNNNNSDATKEYDAAVKTLWLNMDKLKANNNKRIFVILATNKFKNLHPTLVSRFGSDTIEILNPNKEMRYEVIKYYAKTFALPITKNETKALVCNTANLSIRDIEQSIAMAKRKAAIENMGMVKLQNVSEAIAIIKQNPRQDEHNDLQADQRSLIKWNKIQFAVTTIATIIGIYMMFKKGGSCDDCKRHTTIINNHLNIKKEDLESLLSTKTLFRPQIQ